MHTHTHTLPPNHTHTHTHTHTRTRTHTRATHPFLLSKHLQPCTPASSSSMTLLTTPFSNQVWSHCKAFALIVSSVWTLFPQIATRLTSSPPVSLWCPYHLWQLEASKHGHENISSWDSSDNVTFSLSRKHTALMSLSLWTWMKLCTSLSQQTENLWLEARSQKAVQYHSPVKGTKVSFRN